jgi:hypothetical protein
VRITTEGYVALHPFCSPVVALSQFQYGSTPNNLQTLTDCSQAWFEDQQIIIPLSQMAGTYSSQGPLSFAFSGGARNQLFVKYSYVSGYVNNLMSSAITGATSMTAINATGVTAGMTMRIIDGAKTESVTVASNYTFGSLTIPLTAALIYDHDANTLFSNMPNAIKEACILVTSAFIKARGDGSMTMAITTSAFKGTEGSSLYGSDLATAGSMLSLYRRIR